MDNLEKVEKLRQKTGVSYEEAKSALEACEYDLLEAIVYLEKLGKIPEPETASYTTQDRRQSREFEQAQQEYQKDSTKRSSGDTIQRFFKWCGRVLKKCCEATFEVSRNDKNMVSVPVIVLLLCLAGLFWLTVVLLIVGLFCGCRYSFKGLSKTSIDINDVCDKASETCENIKSDFGGKN